MRKKNASTVNDDVLDIEVCKDSELSLNDPFPLWLHSQSDGKIIVSKFKQGMNELLVHIELPGVPRFVIYFRRPLAPNTYIVLPNKETVIWVSEMPEKYLPFVFNIHGAPISSVSMPVLLARIQRLTTYDDSICKKKTLMFEKRSASGGVEHDTLSVRSAVLDQGRDVFVLIHFGDNFSLRCTYSDSPSTSSETSTHSSYKEAKPDSVS